MQDTLGLVATFAVLLALSGILPIADVVAAIALVSRKLWTLPPPAPVDKGAAI